MAVRVNARLNINTGHAVVFGKNYRLIFQDFRSKMQSCVKFIIFIGG
ncbi:hypothetical protein X741_23800 [Mesorhizobium sp. LNHC229A00]|nr:hypothetical protein X741_23800 [Mesorhizobium sp. LNHC229A00]